MRASLKHNFILRFLRQNPHFSSFRIERGSRSIIPFSRENVQTRDRTRFFSSSLFPPSSKRGRGNAVRSLPFPALRIIRFGGTREKNYTRNHNPLTFVAACFFVDRIVFPRLFRVEYHATHFTSHLLTHRPITQPVFVKSEEKSYRFVVNGLFFSKKSPLFAPRLSPAISIDEGSKRFRLLGPNPRQRSCCCSIGLVPIEESEKLWEITKFADET